jgi:hypothetical protein
MIWFNSPISSQDKILGIFINHHVPVHVASEITGYNIQYLRRMLRKGKVELPEV